MKQRFIITINTNEDGRSVLETENEGFSSVYEIVGALEAAKFSFLTTTMEEKK